MMSRRVHHPMRRWQGCGGLTLVEMLISLAATGLIALALASMLAAVGQGTQSSNDMRDRAIRSKTLTTRISAALRGSRMVLDEGDGVLVLWRPGPDSGDEPRRSELQRLEFDANSGHFRSYFNPALGGDQTYPLSSDFVQVTRSLIQSQVLEGEVWASDVADWQWHLDTSTPHDARLVSYRLTLGRNSVPEVAIHAASLRN